MVFQTRIVQIFQFVLTEKARKYCCKLKEQKKVGREDVSAIIPKMQQMVNCRWKSL